MTFTIVIILSLIVVISLVFYIHRRKRRNMKKFQLLGLVYIKQIKKIISLVQAHRGLTTAWKNGDSSQHTKLVKLKQQISQETQKLVTSSVSENERFEAFSDHWQRLVKIDETISSSNSFEQHTKMIKNLAYMLEDTAEAHHLTASFVTEFINIGYIWRELIVAMESIGQSRAIGTGVATLQFCSSVDKIRLEFLIQSMTKVSDHTLQNLSYLSQEQNTHLKLIEKASKKINTLISVITKELLEEAEVSINNNSYFDLATHALAEIEEVFIHQIKQLNIALK